MKIAFLIYDGMTALDFIGIYDPITRLKSMDFLPNLQWEICAIAPEVRDHHGLRFLPSQISPSLADYDMAIVPGGMSANLQVLMDTTPFVEWLQTAKNCQYKVSVCTGALLLGEAGFLVGKKATTHPDSFEKLQKYCEVVRDQRLVDESDIITARGVTASIDLGLYICEKLAGEEAREKISEKMDYPYYN